MGHQPATGTRARDVRAVLAEWGICTVGQDFWRDVSGGGFWSGFGVWSFEKSGAIEEEGATASGSHSAGGGGRDGGAIGDGLFCYWTETEDG